MHGTRNVMIVVAQQAELINIYHNTRLKLQKTSVAVWHSKTCRSKQLQPKHIQIKINGNSQWSTNMKQAAIKYRLNQEIKFLYSGNHMEVLYIFVVMYVLQCYAVKCMWNAVKFWLQWMYGVVVVHVILSLKCLSRWNFLCNIKSMVLWRLWKNI
jgi:hypothetical protein